MRTHCGTAFAGFALASTSSAQLGLGFPGAEILGGTNAAIRATAIAGLTVDDQYDISNDLEDWDNVVPDFTSLDAMLWIAASNAGSGACDVHQDGSCTPADFTAWIAAFNASMSRTPYLCFF